MRRRFRVQLVFTLAACLMWAAATALLIGAPQAQAAPQAAEARISAADLATLLARRGVIVLDVRDDAMFRRGHLPDARLVPPDQWREVAGELRTATLPIVTYCSCPQEETSLRAASVLRNLGVLNIRALTGGYEGWAQAGRPIVAAFAPVSTSSTAPPPQALQGEAARETWQRVPDLFAAMGVKEGAVVADIGAGSGFFTTRLARAVGSSGRVYAVDISANALNALRQRVEREGLANVELALGTPADPKLPAAQLDAALIINAYHEMTEHQAMLAAIKRALKPTGRLVIVEPIVDAGRGAPRANQESQHQIGPQYVQQDAIAAGFLITRFEDPFTRRGGNMPEYLIALTPAPPPAADMPEHAHANATDDLSRRPDEVVAALSLTPGQVVFDIGAGSGLFTRRFARVVGPAGRAVGLDIEPAIVSGLKADAASLCLANYEARLVAPDDPAIPSASADVIFLSNTYHHIQNRIPYFTRVRAALKPGGRLVIVDFDPGAMGGMTMEGHPDRKQVEAELAAAGFRLTRTHTFLERQFFLEFVTR